MLLATSVVVAATLVPVVMSLVLASRQARAEQERSALRYAADVLGRSESTAGQIAAAFERLAKLPDEERCGPDVLSELRAIDAGSSYIQLVGVLEGDAMVCSSFGPQSPAIALGPVGYVSALGFRVRQDVRFPFAPTERFVVVANDRFAAVIHKALPVDVTVTEPGVALAIVAASQEQALATRGDIRRSWVTGARTLPPGESRVVLQDGTAIAQVRGLHYDLLAVAAVGDEHYRATIQEFALAIGPFGLLAGGLLGWLFLRIVRAQMSLPAAIRAALRNGDFSIELQPIVRLSDRRWVGAEVLMRWQRPDGTRVGPDVFIEAAEDAGMIGQVTEHMLRLSQPVLAVLAREHPGTYLSVNLASADLGREELPRALASLLSGTGASASQLRVEITERAFLEPDVARQQLERIRALGIHVAIDDFGTGYSSLSELVQLEVDALKIDKAFIDAIGGGTETCHVAEHIANIAHGLSLEMVAEGIEHEPQAEILVRWGVRFGQGFLFSAPLPVDEFIARLAGCAPG